MRFVPTYCIKEEYFLAKPVLNANGDVLLNSGVQLRQFYIQRLTDIGVSGVYINDPISEDLIIDDVLPDALRTKVVSGIKDAFVNAARQKKTQDETARATEMFKFAQNIVDEILSDGGVLLNLADIKIYDEYTFFHCLQVAILSVVLGLGAGFSNNKLVKLAVAALMHDIGKVFVPEKIINKPGKLTPQEYEQVKVHSRNGYNYLRNHYQLAEISALGALEHHERYDGSGYPDGKKGAKITEFGRIIAIADVYDAMTSDRPYRKGLFAVDAAEYLMSGSGTQFDPDYLTIMSRKVALFPVGTCVSLSNGATGLVMENYEGFAQRPKLKIFKEGANQVKPYLLDLCNDYSTLGISIVSTVAV